MFKSEQVVGQAMFTSNDNFLIRVEDAGNVHVFYMGRPKVYRIVDQDEWDWATSEWNSEEFPI